MTDEEFKREVEGLVRALNNLRLIRDKGQRKRFKAEIRAQLAELMNY